MSANLIWIYINIYKKNMHTTSTSNWQHTCIPIYIFRKRDPLSLSLPAHPVPLTKIATAPTHTHVASCSTDRIRTVTPNTDPPPKLPIGFVFRNVYFYNWRVKHLIYKKGNQIAAGGGGHKYIEYYNHSEPHKNHNNTKSHTLVFREHANKRAQSVFKTHLTLITTNMYVFSILHYFRLALVKFCLFNNEGSHANHIRNTQNICANHICSFIQ